MFQYKEYKMPMLYIYNFIKLIYLKKISNEYSISTFEICSDAIYIYIVCPRDFETLFDLSLKRILKTHGRHVTNTLGQIRTSHEFIDYWIHTRSSIHTRVSRAQPRINAYEISLQHDWLLLVFLHHVLK